MRVVSGKYRGLVLAEFSGSEIRPTADRVKESLFNILFNKVFNASVLDLFCGSGNLGIECLSRGASFVQFNDISKQSLTVLQQNLKKLKGENSYKITNFDYLICLSQANQGFDIIFIDPPYRFDFGESALSAIKKYNLLKQDGIIVYERDVPFMQEVEGFEKYDERKYGKTYLSFFKLKGEL
ncbi:MAG: 16S rRNA (guanine(966)-N(2))-methyltransferase RsmD [Clostridiales bacterium]|nr:16S rRNA (guanine(966)-N(2))-methyltransferase RsmD [Clostridiales bacterium]